MRYLFANIIFLIIFILNINAAGSQTDSSFAAENHEAELGDSLSVADTMKVETDSVKFYFLSVKTNIENAEIYSDTVFIGRTPLDTFKIKEGMHFLKIINPISLKEWSNYIIRIEADIKKDTTINVEFDYFYFINTIPFNVKVFNNDSLLGETPLRFYREKKLEGFLNFVKRDYKDKVFDLRNYDFKTGLSIELLPKGTETVNDIVYQDRSTQFKTKRPLPPIFGTALLAVGSGIFAINYKQSANNEYDRYLRTGNTTFLDNANSDDTVFTVSIILMQAALAGLIYFLFFD
ncbi:MAG TPA: PEGA domain-containing protein [Ignavibacteria bacterium]|nr:PEGA domain-containing protein [Ignavibacteria bacterium]HMR41719.1 PEGA domain-containing protein [Ignavibacteria bacterium]